MKLATPAGKYVVRAIGPADDYLDADGSTVLSFYQAQEKARLVSESAKKDSGLVRKPLTISEAASRYLIWFRAHRRSFRETDLTIQAHILPELGDFLVDSISSTQIRTWLDNLAVKPARIRVSRFAKDLQYRAAAETSDEKRARRASANRILTVLKAILNRAFHEGLATDDTAWRKVKPFAKADQPRIRFLTDSEAIRLVNVCPPDLRALVRAALLTGARYGELVSIRAHDVNLRTAQIYIAQAKSDKPRHIPLNAEGVRLFSDLLVGKTGASLIFVRGNSAPWGKSHQIRPLLKACEAAKIDPPIAFHELRHTYASHLAQAGVDILSISKLLGHADTRITSRHYAHLADRTLADAVTRLPNFNCDRRAVVIEAPQVVEVR